MSHKSINQLHDEGLIEHFMMGKGYRVFILTPSYPFMFIGEIKDVRDDIVDIWVETTHFSQLENRLWHIHIDNIEVFYIEREGEPEIPRLSEDYY